jgi:hypothetical protein
MNIVKIIKQYLKKNGYDGLCNMDCGCGINELNVCSEINIDCIPAYKTKANCLKCKRKCSLAGSYEMVNNGYCYRPKKQKRKKRKKNSAH